MRALKMLAGLCLLLTGCNTTPMASDPQVLVDRSALTVQELLGDGNDRLDAANLLRRARAAMICPQTFRAGFFFGGEGGACVLLGRDGAGSWSSPAFYGVGGGSFGFQAGIQDSQTLLLVMSDRALNAVLDSQFRFGADASLAILHLGGSVEAATTANLGADIVAYSRSRGAFAGLALEGSAMSSFSEWNRAYYGREVSGRDIVVAMAVHNPGADPLRAALMRFGQGGGSAAPTAAPAAQPTTSPSSRGTVTRQPLQPVTR
jgi:lipid-binding SYLF domain-containing protein